MDKRKYDVIILGGGPAGYTAALYTSRAGLETAIIEKLSAGGQMAETGNIENYPGFEDGVEGFELGEKMRMGAEKFGASSIYEEVLLTDFSSEIKKIVTNEGEYTADAVIIAMGASAKKLGIEKEEKLTGKGINYCAYCDGMRYKGKEVAVIGGGDSAAEDALYLSKICKKVYLIHRRDKLRAVNSYLNKLEKAENIEILYNSRVKELVEDGKLTAIKIVDENEEKHIDVDAIFVAVGRKPETDIFKGIFELDESGYIKAGEMGKTNIEGVFAAGDIRTKELRQIVTAVADGANSAKSAIEYIENL